MILHRTCRILPLLIAACFLFPVHSTAQQVEGRWTALPNGPAATTGDRHDDVVFINENEGWVANLRGEVHRTTDGGDTWQLTYDNPFVSFRTVAFVTDRIGYLGSLTSGKVLYQTFDGGFNWINITDRIKGSIDAICGIWAVDPQHIYGVGAFFGGPWFVKTDNGGQTWTSKVVGAGAKALVDVYFKNQNVGFAVGGTADLTDGLNGNAVVLRTTDGGSNWSQVHQTSKSPDVFGEWGWKISFPSDLVGYVSIEYNNGQNEPAKYLKTVDGGLTWTEHHIPGSTQTAGLQGIGFVTDDVGWASGRGKTSVTHDGGTTWTQIADFDPDLNPDGELDGQTNRIFVVDETLAFAVGRYTYRFEGIVPVNVEGIDYSGIAPEQPNQFEIDQNFPNPFSTSTTIKYTLFENVDVRITVMDAIGRRVRTLVEAFQTPGEYQVDWDGRDQSGNRLASGNYLYLMDIGEQIEMKRAVLLR